MKMIYSNVDNLMTHILRNNHQVSEEDLKQLEILTTKVNYLTNAVKFLQLLDDALKPMKELLESSTIGDVQEAVAFFVAAYQFNLDGVSEGVLGKKKKKTTCNCRWYCFVVIAEMMTVMQSNEQERKNLIVEAFKKIYLETDSNNLL